MFSVENSVFIDRPAAEVFAVVADPRNDPSWYTDVVEVVQTRGEELGVGAQFRWVLEFFGRKESAMTIAAVEPDRRVQFEVSWGQKAAVFSYGLVPKGSGTRLTRMVETTACGMPRAGVPIVRGVIQRRDRAFLRNLKALLEGRERTPVPAAETMVPEEQQYPAEAM